MNGLNNPLCEISEYSEIINCLKINRLPILVTNVIESQKVHLGANIQKGAKKMALYVTHSEVKAKEIYEDLKLFMGNKVKFYPSKDIIFYSADVRSAGIMKERFEIIDDIINDDDITVVLSIEALFDRLTDREFFKKSVIKIEVSDQLNRDEFLKNLVFLGYERTDLVEGTGQFSTRGSIIDVFSPTMENPIRIEFWGDEIDSIRLLDSFSQRSIEKIEYAEIFPMRELVYGEKELDETIVKIKEELDKTLNKYQKKNLLEESETLKNNINEIIEKINIYKNFSGIENYSHYFSDANICFLDYIDKKNTIIFFDEPSRISSHAETILFEFEESIKNRILKGELLPSSINIVFNYQEILSKILEFPLVALMTLPHNIKDFEVKEIYNFNVKSSGVMQGRVDLLIEDLKFYVKNKYRILILAGATVRGERLVRELSENGLSCTFVDNLENYNLEKSVITISKGNLNRGFEYTDIKFVVITDKELLSKDSKTKKRSKKKKGTKIESFTDLKIGDYIVHENHGIGVYKGIEKMVVDNTSRDYIKLQYSDGGHLYVATSQMDLVQKYVGSEAGKIKLNKLGGNDWNKTKSKAKGTIQILAKDLVKLYAARESTKGYSFTLDTVWQKEFEDLFPYEETEDQIISVEEIKEDMESQKVMDRLLCGDVGYGKTEVAIRAAFKAVQDGKQVAYLVPTTILAQQHYNTFIQRMKDFPISIDMLSRFRTAKQQKLTIEGIKKGSVDIVIGTHRLFSKDIIFKDLGFIIIDEEQRFGVAQKEKLKRIKENTDVLSLSATPIPRTLHMSLTGIRDISVLTEPPQERQPVQTYVMEYNDTFVRDAILREYSRGGQVYYLHNRVKNISEVCTKLQNLVPEANIAYAHGQMSERELEQIMFEFIECEIDVLVCTTIIETGLDIPNSNTIIIQDADYMGLSQLYQLRGRVGRSNRSAYAYLMYKKDKSLNEIAEKRLQTIKEFTEFGSGFKIAMRDLEIRGAGNLLGAEQHGHMDSIGYEMYCKLLDEEVKRLKGEVVEESFETNIDIVINAYIPTFYIKNEEQKLEIYKKISFVKNQQDYYDIQEEIEDRYGDVPSSVNNLLEVALLKSVAHDIGITSIVQKRNNIIITFKKDAKVNLEILKEIIYANKNRILFTSSAEPYLTYKLNEEETSISLPALKDILYKLLEKNPSVV